MNNDDKILFVDDEASILAGLKRQLRKKFNISTASSGPEALELVKRDGPFSVVVSDMRMPDMLGTEVLKRLQTLSPDTTRMMLTGNADQKTAMEAVNEGNVFRFFTKPCPTDVLVQGLEAGIRRYELITRTKTDLMANMNHELRTPLNAIIGFSKIMKDEMFGPVGNDTYLEYISDINQSSEFLLGLINDILDVSDFGAGTLQLTEESVDLRAVVDASIRLVRPRADKGQVTITSLITPENPTIVADARRVKQVFLHLLSNAVKFTPEGGEVTVSSGLDDDGAIVTTVADTGIGMNNEEIAIALTRFGQVDGGLNRKVQEGTGLGLPLSEGLMELHGGTLNVASESGLGTQVSVSFPKERIVQNT